MVKIKGTQFCVKKLENDKKKGQKNLTFRSGDSNPRFSVSFQPTV
jgi:hypothetical protein